MTPTVISAGWRKRAVYADANGNPTSVVDAVLPLLKISAAHFPVGSAMLGIRRLGASERINVIQRRCDENRRFESCSPPRGGSCGWAEGTNRRLGYTKRRKLAAKRTNVSRALIEGWGHPCVAWGAPVRQYRIVGGDTEALKGKLGHTVEVTGPVGQKESGATTNGLYNSGSTTGVGYNTITAQSVKEIYANCS
jgi:hypothetical protein